MPEGDSDTPDPGVVVSTQIRIAVAGDQGVIEVDGRVLRLDPSGRQVRRRLSILQGLQSLGHPVYLKVDGGVITALRVPVLGRVVRLYQAAPGRVHVELDNSNGRHVLVGPDADPRLDLLRRASIDHSVVVLTSDDRGVILDVRPYEPGLDDGPRPPFPTSGPGIPRWLRRMAVARRRWPQIHSVWSWPWPWGISVARAQRVFDALAGTSCAPLTMERVPFPLPDNGCSGRAHEMCRLMIGMSLSPRKVWIDADRPNHLTVTTKHNPDGAVAWYWNVAPTLVVRSPRWFPRTMVFDPSLFTTPVTEATWKSVQGDVGATLTFTSATQFGHGGGTDPNYSSTNYALVTYRMALQARALGVVTPSYAYGCASR